jgi:hypothetical protein
MNARHRLVCGCLMVLIACWHAPAHPLPITGSFAGRADGIVFDFSFETDGRFFNLPVFGQFSFDTELDRSAEIHPEDGNAISIVFQPASVRFELPSSGFGNLDFNSGAGAIRLFDDGSIQTFEISNGTGLERGSVTLLSPTRTLFRDFDLASFTPAGIDLAASFAQFDILRVGAATARFDGLAFYGLTATFVPAPPPWTLLLVGTVALLRTSRRLCASGHQPSS